MPRSRRLGAKWGALIRGIFDKETRRRPLAFAADAVLWGFESTFACNQKNTRQLQESGETALKRRKGAWPLEYATRSVRRASGFVLVGNSEATPNL